MRRPSQGPRTQNSQVSDLDARYLQVGCVRDFDDYNVSFEVRMRVRVRVRVHVRVRVRVRVRVGAFGRICVRAG